MTPQEIGQMIRTMRMTREMSQKDLAKATGLSQSAIAMYEQGRRRPGDDAAEALADVFNVPKWSIFYNEDEMVPAVEEAEQVPRTKEARMISAGIDRMPEEERKRAQALMELAFSKYY